MLQPAIGYLKEFIWIHMGTVDLFRDSHTKWKTPSGLLIATLLMQWIVCNFRQIWEKVILGDTLRQLVWKRHIWGQSRSSKQPNPDTFHRAGLEIRNTAVPVDITVVAQGKGNKKSSSSNNFNICKKNNNKARRNTLKKEYQRKENVYLIIRSPLWQLLRTNIIFNRPWHIHFWPPGWVKESSKKNG